MKDLFPKPDCEACPVEKRCIEDRRINKVKGRQTKFRILQDNATDCSFERYIPGFEENPSDDYVTYLRGWEDERARAGAHLFGSEFGVESAALAKVKGDLLELILSAQLWNLAADWNHFMDTGVWNNTILPKPDAFPTAARKVAILNLPRGYASDRLLSATPRSELEFFNQSLLKKGMELKFSTPDIVGVRLPHPLTEELKIFSTRLENLKHASRSIIQGSHKLLEGKIESHGFLLAIAVKKSARSDRLYQPLFEANVLKTLFRHVMHGSSPIFQVHMMDISGAAVEDHYRAASLFSVLRGGQMEKAIDDLVLVKTQKDSLSAVLHALERLPV